MLCLNFINLIAISELKKQNMFPLQLYYIVNLEIKILINNN